MQPKQEINPPSLGAINVIRNMFAPQSRFSLDPELKNYEIDNLANYASKCEFLFFKIRYARQVLFQTLIFLFLISHISIPKSSYKISFFTSPFVATDYWGHFIWIWFLLMIFIYLCLILMLFIAFIIFIFKNKLSFEEIFSTNNISTINKFDYTRTFLSAWRNFITIMFLFWGFHILFGVTFHIQGNERLLSGLEFVYFFLMTFTTVGFGDITPISNSGYFFTIMIHLLTLYSIIYLFHRLAKGPRKDVIEGHLEEMTQKHRLRLENIQELLFKTLKHDENDTVACPVSHKIKVGSAKGCNVCKGTFVVNVQKIIPFATWPPMSFFKVLENTTGKSKKELLTILKINKS